MGAKEKALIQERVEHRDAHLRLQLEHPLRLRRRHAEVRVIAVSVADALQMIVDPLTCHVSMLALNAPFEVCWIAHTPI
jgi:hypothetical protein